MISRYIGVIGRIMIPSGITILVLSIWSFVHLQPGSTERVITVINMGVGSFLCISGLFILLWGKRENNR